MPSMLQVAAALYSKQMIRNICCMTHFFPPSYLLTVAGQLLNV